MVPLCTVSEVDYIKRGGGNIVLNQYGAGGTRGRPQFPGYGGLLDHVLPPGGGGEEGPGLMDGGGGGGAEIWRTRAKKRRREGESRIIEII